MTLTMRKVLMFCRCFPPALTVSGKRTYQFAAHLPECGWEPIVATEPIPHGTPLDTTLSALPSIRVERRYLPPVVASASPDLRR